MAIKNHELVADNKQLDLKTLAQYIQALNVLPNYLPPPQELLKQCQEIVECLSHVALDEDDDVWENLQVIEEFLVTIVNKVDDELRKEIITVIIEKFYCIVSKLQTDICPATSIVLVVFQGLDPVVMMEAARWLVQNNITNETNCLSTFLSFIYQWVCEWFGTPILGDFALNFVKALEEKECFEVLVQVSIMHIERLFMVLKTPGDLKQNVTHLIFSLLANMRNSIEVFQILAPHVQQVLVNLAADSGQWSRHLLQTVVDILTNMVEQFISEEAADFSERRFKEENADVISCLERHMASRDCNYLLTTPWPVLVDSDVNTDMQHKVGLHNQGNTCYMNSVIQALFFSKKFSLHVIMRMSNVPYWSRLGMLFAKMLYSESPPLTPTELYLVVRANPCNNNTVNKSKFLGTPVHALKVGVPPFFTSYGQHDSFEFLGYLFEMLQSYEHYQEDSFDYENPSNPHAPVFVANGNGDAGASSSETSASRRSMSPRPSGSGCSANKRPSTSTELSPAVPPKKRKLMKVAGHRPNREMQHVLRRDSVIDKLFGGTMSTKLRCLTCSHASVSYDLFRDLQLAFPEKLKRRQLSVQALLEYYFCEERLSGDNRYRCPSCAELRDAERTVQIHQSPEYLILVLKNFRYEPKTQVQTKLMHPMHYDLSIRLRNERSIDGYSNYSLYAAVIHSGSTLDSGHYYTLAKDTDKWYRLDDANVTPTVVDELNSLTKCCTPYILFYRRSDVVEPDKPQITQLPAKLQTMLCCQKKRHCKEKNNFDVATRP